jgi:hypothetical protein
MDMKKVRATLWYTVCERGTKNEEGENQIFIKAQKVSNP